MTNKVGRPVGDTDARERLIREALRLFVAMPYSKVSTRLVARHAGVNVALISYYFGNKAGLFETMLRETIEPLLEHLKLAMHHGHIKCVGHLLYTQYKVMAPNPDLPKLMIRCMMMEPGDVQRQAVEKIFLDVVCQAEEVMFTKMKESGSLGDEVEPKNARMTFMSMMIFPFLLPTAVLDSIGFELNEESLKELAIHNGDVLTKGLLK